jgi:DNA-binding NarL/FixJ family response regulator
VSEATKVLIVDDHRMFSGALEALLDGEVGFETVGTATSAEEALALAEHDRPDVVLMDIDLPGMNGIEATRRLVAADPDVRVVAISALTDPELLSGAIEAGACGFVPKAHAADELVDLIRQAAEGEMVLPAADVAGVLERLRSTPRPIRSEAQDRLARLTPREIEVLQAFADGCSTREAAERLFITSKTVRSHVDNILAKLEVHSKLDAVVLVLRHGVISLGTVAAP